MKERDEKITLLQALLVYLVAMHTASMRYTTSTTAGIAHQASWLSVPLSMIVYIPLVYMLFRVAKKFEGKSLHDIFCRVFGTFLGKTLCVLFLLWLMMLLALYLRYTSGNLVTTILVGTDEKLLNFMLVVTVGVMLRWGVAVIARMNKLIFVLILLQFAVTLFFLFLHFRADYITPISTLDIAPLIQSIVFPLTILVYITPLFIFNDRIRLDKKNAGKFVFTSAYITVINVLMMLALLGMVGYQLISKWRLPFFSAVENINIFNSSAGLDSLFMSIWMLAEFITVTFFTYCASRMIKGIFNLDGETPLLSPLLAFTMFFATYFSRDVFEITKFSANIAPYLNLSFGLLVPILLFFTAKIRKML